MATGLLQKRTLPTRWAWAAWCFLKPSARGEGGVQFETPAAAFSSCFFNFSDIFSTLLDLSIPACNFTKLSHFLCLHCAVVFLRCFRKSFPHSDLKDSARSAAGSSHPNSTGLAWSTVYSLLSYPSCSQSKDKSWTKIHGQSWTLQPK